MTSVNYFLGCPETLCGKLGSNMINETFSNFSKAPTFFGKCVELSFRKNMKVNIFFNSVNFGAKRKSTVGTRLKGFSLKNA